MNEKKKPRDDGCTLWLSVARKPRCQLEQGRTARLFCRSAKEAAGSNNRGKHARQTHLLEGVRFPRWWCETMDDAAYRTRPKFKWLWCIFAERRGEQLQRPQHGAFVHNLITQSIKTLSQNGGRGGERLMSFSTPHPSEMTQL